MYDPNIPDYHSELPENTAPYGRTLFPETPDGEMGKGPERHLAYDVAKAGVAQMARVLAAEWASYGIRINAIAPGYTETPILREVGQTDPRTLDAWLVQVPQGRLIQPTEIARVVAFLASEQASAVTGHVLFADAGYSAW